MSKLEIIDILTLDSGLYDECETYWDKFQLMSRYLLNDCLLVIAGEEWKIAEIEYYLTDDTHKDPFIHGDEHQSTPGRWYFHRQNGKNYKSGTYKGLDITFGYQNSSSKVYGGILIRSIYQGKTFIEGPCKTVDKILELNGYDSINDLVSNYIDEDETLPIYSSLLKLTWKKGATERHILWAPRVGLTLKRYTKAREQYLMKDYRFLNSIKYIKKFRSGVILSLHKAGASSDEINGMISTSKKNIDKYINTFEGATGSAKDYHGKKLGVADLCKLQKLCQSIVI